MGWLSMPLSLMGGHRTAKAYLDAQFTYERQGDDGGIRGLRVLASSCPGNRVWYAAAQQYTGDGPGDTVAVVCLVRWNPRDAEGCVFGYKDMDETMGPCEAACPAAILRLLSTTDHPHALDWRRRCLASLRRRDCPIADGMLVRLAKPLAFDDGHVGDLFRVEKRGRRLSFRDPASGHGYRISHFAARAWSVVPETRVHATRFA